MGTIEKGYLGGFKGIVGTAVGSKWKGKTVIKSRPPRKRTVPASDLQAQQQAKFALMTTFLRPLTGLLNRTYSKPAGSEMSGFNKAFSQNSDAISGVYPAIVVDYGKILLSRGSLPNADTVTVASAATGKLVFTWADNSDGETALSSDTAFVAVYNEELNRWIQKQRIAERSAGTCTLDLPLFSGKAVQTYIGFMSADRKKVAKSLYTGLVNIL